MNRFVSIALIFILSGHCLTQLGYMTWFEWNRAEIAATHCVNKSKPEMKCNGRCHMTKTLEKWEDKTPSEKTEARMEMLSLPLFLIASFDWSWGFDFTETKQQNTFCNPLVLAGVCEDSFKPPRG